MYDLSGLLMLNDVVNRIVEDAKPPFGPDGSIWAGGNETDPLATGPWAAVAANDKGLVRVSYRLLGLLPEDDLVAASIRPVPPDHTGLVTSHMLSQRLRLLMSKVDRLPR
jgi:hypothetical protein